eukprot:INCI19667.1.p1 GENE.INCI19667.1~~INCI19667.1.p1  ORF type:complete len:211 (+),score=33.93 INCI19667.1:90-722(+)
MVARASGWGLFIAWLNFGSVVVAVATSASPNIAERMRQLYQMYDPNENLFSILDVDGSRSISRDEFDTFFALENKQAPPNLWEGDDRNFDGMLSFEEFSGPKGNNAGSVQPRPQTGAAVHETGVSVKGTGSRPLLPFDALDTNSDGAIGYDEFKAYFYYAFSKGVTTQKQPSLEALHLAGIPDLFQDHDSDENGLITRQEFQAFWSRVGQ